MTDFCVMSIAAFVQQHMLDEHAISADTLLHSAS